MRIIHVCLASHYTEGMNYQDNILPDVNSQDGHEVLIISDTQKYIDGKLVVGVTDTDYAALDNLDKYGINVRFDNIEAK